MRNNKDYIIRVTRMDTGAVLYSGTNNVDERIKMLKYDIASINGNGTHVHERFVPFVGATEADVKFEVFAHTQTI